MSMVAATFDPACLQSPVNSQGQYDNPARPVSLDDKFGYGRLMGGVTQLYRDGTSEYGAWQGLQGLRELLGCSSFRQPLADSSKSSFHFHSLQLGPELSEPSDH